ncbi:hypothetical protein [Klebsiella pneumoniae]|uniref:hypothetical protein n=1 Tax=Klebsiella pneumoniae TaxID=573 RepID=UPI000D1A5092|nr:hypothetical protein [Klebsiella pneumoniae]
MPFIKIPYTPTTSTPREQVYTVPYIRLSRDSDCSLSKTFLWGLEEGENNTIDFEYEPNNGGFRFRVGENYDRPLVGGKFQLPSAVLRTIWYKNIIAAGKNQVGSMRRSAYFQPVLKDDGWWYGVFQTFIRPNDRWI